MGSQMSGAQRTLLASPDQPGTATPADTAFDARVLTAILRHAMAERETHGGSLARRLGLGGTALGILLMLYMPDHAPLTAEDYVFADECEEQEWVRTLLTSARSTPLEQSRWLASIIARRALEAAHLWEDLGLASRADLSQLMARHFAPLFAANTADMRWKRFLYRRLCEQEGLVRCTSPTCSACPDILHCFPAESAEALIAASKSAPASPTKPLTH